MATTKARFTISVDNDLFDLIEDYRFAHRCSTRSDAATELLVLGLKAVGMELRTQRSKGDSRADILRKEQEV